MLMACVHVVLVAERIARDEHGSKKLAIISGE